MSCAPQKISDSEEPSFRIVGGTATWKKVEKIGIENIKTQ
jgi:hypothetical protein